MRRQSNSNTWGQNSRDNKKRFKMVFRSCVKVMMCAWLLLISATVVASSAGDRRVLKTESRAGKSASSSWLFPSKNHNGFLPSRSSSTPQSNLRIRQRRLPGEENDYFQDMDMSSMGEGFALGAVFILVLLVLCCLCCLCSCCCGGGGGGGSCLTDLLAMFCCYELFCDGSPGCDFVPMDGEMC